MTRQVLVVDDDAAVREALAQTLELADLDPLPAGSFVAAKDRITPDFDGVILSDIRMPGRDGFFLLDHTLKLDPELPVILLTGEGDIPMAVDAMKRGAFGFLEKPCASAELLPILERALKTRELVLENRRLKAQLESGDPAARMIFGRSEQSEALRRRIRQLARLTGEVLVTGAPGAGISKVAEVIHLSSPAAQRPFVKRASAGLGPEALDAAFQEAAGGSLYLDEIAGLGQAAQFALAELMERGAPARLIAGCSTALRQAVEEGGFNADLYYRLEPLSVHSPALKERPEDIPVMFRQYVAQAAEQSGMAAPEVTPEVVAGLMTRDWPGNARSLMSAAMRFVLSGGEAEEERPSDLGLAEQMAQIEKSLLSAALKRHAGHASAAAEALKLPRKTFYDKLAKHGLRPESFR
ncbi:sigma-54 dependent transcriptional regulator [Pseudooceanicola sp. CBS1P-1]|uniref:Response regulator n=1 Tax=Pseudooceanicola albus TaxID=2692189 RepID=A0A6L7FY47_9RHOB|nr:MULTISPECIES: sigma-54 dependent transcriptional regulator [Pseudooceanicola]MBT9382463.1 sigma-54 dependent transcriptional regulator [Pseudooceanicola endophyticus]MXN17004.1 response regulator [Pseudooceanicola albus]